MSRFGSHIPAGLRDLVPFAKTRKKARTKRQRLKQRKRKRIMLLVLGVCAILFAAIVGVSRIDAIAITEVSVYGTKAIDSVAVAERVQEHIRGNYAFVFPKGNTFIYPKDMIRTDLLETYPRIKTLTLTRASLTELSVDIKERTPHALWCGDAADMAEIYNREQQSHCYFLDDTGVIFAKAPHITGNVYFTYYGNIAATEPVGAHLMRSQQFVQTERLIGALAEISFEPVALTQPNAEDVFVHMQNGSFLKIARADDFNTVLANIQSVLNAPALAGRRDELAYIDVRFGKRVYYRFRGEETEGAGPTE